jgi:trehalose 6-phosphate synthase/phosphatase
MENSDKSLILVSNRLPFQLLEQEGNLLLKQSDGGLVTALKSYFNAESNRGVFTHKKWFGAADFPEKRWNKFKKQSSVPGDFSVEPLKQKFTTNTTTVFATQRCGHCSITFLRM